MDEIQIIKEPVKLSVIKEMAKNQFGHLVKAVVDVEREIMAIGGELHADEEVLLSESGSERENTWGINLYPDKSEPDWIEFDSMVNIKPQYNNCSRSVEDVALQEKITIIVNKLVDHGA